MARPIRMLSLSALVLMGLLSGCRSSVLAPASGDDPAPVTTPSTPPPVLLTEPTEPPPSYWPPVSLWPKTALDGLTFETTLSEYPTDFDNLTVVVTNTGFESVFFMRNHISLSRKISDEDDADPKAWESYADGSFFTSIYLVGSEVALSQGESFSFSLTLKEIVGEEFQRNGAPLPPGTYRLVLNNQVTTHGPDNSLQYYITTPLFTLTAP
ncbi:MAG: hypothetical protein LBT60_05575 [Oscillospiraceae bacterium]|jgi:hypothetical protein|nr:hypothetical protein [Oscillospiraceae bacterium]